MKWSPIEGAPKDGTEILGFCDGHRYVIAWNVQFEYWALCGDCMGEGCDPTLWMPLPPLP